MTDPTYPLFSIFSFLGFILGLIPFSWHMQAWNAATCAYMIWSSIASLIVFVDSIVWRGNINNPAPVWCDVSTKFLIGAGVGIPAASLCINMRLYKIASVRLCSVSNAERKRAMLLDLAISVGLPIIVMALHYIVQGHRFNILEDIGCIPTIFNTPPAYPLVYMWPVLLGCISFIFAFLNLRSFWIRRSQFNEVLSATNSMTANRYWRLMLLSCMEMLLTIPLTSFSIYINTFGLSLAPWVSWSDTHFNFSFVERVPAVVWRSNSHFATAAEMGRWIYPSAALLFFALFGFASEARRNYCLAFWWVAKHLGVRRHTRGTPEMTLSYPSRFVLSSVGDSLPPYSPSISISATTKSTALPAKEKEIDIEKSSNSPTSTSSFLAFYRSSTLYASPTECILNTHSNGGPYPPLPLTSF